MTTNFSRLARTCGLLSASRRIPGDADFPSARGPHLRAGLNTQEGRIAPDALKIHTKSGDATAKDKLRVDVEVEIIEHFQTKNVTACVLKMVQGEKV